VPESINLHEYWPALPLSEWQATRDTFHMWTQIVGKVRLALAPAVNHWWHVPLYVTPRGLTTSFMPYGSGGLEIGFDFIAHRLVIQTSSGDRRDLPLEPRSVADFYAAFRSLLNELHINVHIWPMPVEVPDPIRFDQDHVHAAYDRVYAERFWRILLTLDRVFHEFRGGFIGKCSPVHFFWGSFDLAVSRFSGRPAPPRPNADRITQEAYSHEVSSVGFWPGGGDVKGAAFFSYTAPEPSGFRTARVQPASAYYDTKLGLYLLMYDDLRKSATPHRTLLDFCETAYVAGAGNAKWDRTALERATLKPDVVPSVRTA
jgi:hypothetical protein